MVAHFCWYFSSLKFMSVCYETYIYAALPDKCVAIFCKVTWKNNTLIWRKIALLWPFSLIQQRICPWLGWQPPQKMQSLLSQKRGISPGFVAKLFSFTLSFFCHFYLKSLFDDLFFATMALFSLIALLLSTSRLSEAIFATVKRRVALRMWLTWKPLSSQMLTLDSSHACKGNWMWK